MKKLLIKKVLLFLDSAGSEVPLLDYDKNFKDLKKEEALIQLVRIAKDKALTELFSKDLLYHLVICYY